MPKLPKNQKMLSISQAADVLGVSVDTLRRWDKKGLIQCTRGKCNVRYFSAEELEKMIFSRPMSISEAAEKLGISQTTLRRLEARGVIKPERGTNGERLYTKESINEFLNEEYFLRKKQIEESSALPVMQNISPQVVEMNSELSARDAIVAKFLQKENERIDKALKFRNIFISTSIVIVTFFALMVTGITLFFLFFPDEASQMLGYTKDDTYAMVNQSIEPTNNALSFPRTGGRRSPPAHEVATGVGESRSKIDSWFAARNDKMTAVLGAKDSKQNSLIANVLRPFSKLSLRIVKAVDEKTYKKIVPKEPVESVDDVFVIDEKGEVVADRPIKISDSSNLQIGDDAVIKNLNSEFIQGRTPGDGEGNLVVFASNGTIDNLTVQASNIAPGSITRDKLAPGLLLAPDDDSVLTGAILDGTIINADIADSAAIADGKLAQIKSSNKVAGSSIQVSSGGGLENSSGLSLLRSCGSGQILKYSNGSWVCASFLSGAVDSVNALTGAINIAGSGIVSVSTSSGTITLTGTEADTLAAVTGRGATTSTAVSFTGGVTSSALTVSSLNTAGAVVYTNGSGALGVSAQGTSGECLLSGGSGTPTWGSCGSGTADGTSNWRIISGGISAVNDTLDLLVGSSATGSAKFGFLNVNSGTPTASISANSGANATYLTGAGVLGTTNARTLTLGNATTGNVVIDSGSSSITLSDATTINGTLTTTGAVNGATLTGGSLSATAVNGVTTADIVLTSGSYADPAWITSLAKSKVGLGSVENTALSTWAGTSNITTLGTLTSGTTGTGFTLNFTNSTLSGNITGANISGVDISDDTNLSASDGITLTGDALTNSDKGSSQNIFKTLAVSGQSNVVSDANSDTLTLTAGSNVTITTDASTDTVTIAATDTNTTYSAGTDLDLTATTFSLETTLDSVDTINLAGTGTLNGLDAIDATTETTLESALDIGGDVTGTGLGSVSLASNVVDDAELVDSLSYTGTLTIANNALAVNSDSITSDGTTLTINAAGTVAIQDIVSVSGGVGSKAALIVDQLNNGDLLSASAAGTTRFTVANNGNVTASGTINSTTLTGGSLSSTAVNGVTTADIVLTSGSYADPAWITSLAKSKVGLGSVENTALSTWAGTSNITTLGTLTSGTTGTGFTLNFTNSTLSGNITGSNLSGVDISDDTNLSASDGITLTGDALTNSDKGSSQNIFKTIAVSGQSNVVSDANSDTLTFIAGSNITLTTDASNDTVTISAAGGGGGGSSNWVLTSANGTLNPINNTLDLLVGGTSTASAKFAVVNVAGGTPTASISANSGANASYLTGGGVLGTTNAQTLTIGSSSTGNIIIDSGSGLITLGSADTLGNGTWSISSSGVGTSLTSSDLSCTNCIGGTEIDESALSLTKSMVGLGNVENTALSTWAGTSNITTTGTLTSGSTSTGFTLNFTNSTLSGNITGSNIDESTFGAITGTSLTIGSGATSAPLSVRSGIGSNAGLIVDQLNSGDLLAASASGTTKLRVNNSGDILLGGTTGITNAGVGTFDSSISTPTINLSGTGTLNGLDAIDATTETTLESAIDIAGDVTGTGLGSVALASNVVDDAELVDTLSYTGTLTIANNALAVNSDSITSDGTTLTINAAGNLAVQDVLAVSGGYGSKAALIVDQLNNGDLLSASAAGTTRFTVANNGNVTASGTINSATLTGGSLSSTAVNGVTTADIVLTSGSYADPAWITSLAKSKVGLGSVENTALSTWAGSTNITTLGTLTSGTTGTGFTLNFTNSTLSGNITGANISGVDVSDDTNLSASNGVTLTGDALSLDQAFAPTWTSAHTFSLAETEDLQIDISISGTNAGQGELLTLTNSSSSGNQYGLYLDNAASTGTTESLLVIDNSDTDTAVTNAIQFVNAGGGFTNLFDVAGTTITSTEFTLIDSGVALSELSDSGTLTAGTVDINGGAIDGTTIGATSRSSGAFTTLASNSTVTIGDGSGTDNITLDDGAGSITFTGYNSCTALETNSSGVLTCGTDDTGAGGGGSSNWVLTSANGTLNPINNTLDLLIGGTATSSAKFAVVNIAGGTPTASISAASGNNASFLTGAGVLGTTNAQTLTVGPSTTGDIRIGTDAVARTITLGAATNTDLVLLDAQWNITGAGVGTFASVSTPTIDLSGTGTLNGLDAIDATSETTLEGALDVGGEITGTGLGSVTINANVIDDSELVDTLSYTGTLTIATNALAVNSDSITADGATLTINAAGAVDIQDNLTADSLTLDTGALAINNSGGITSNQATLTINAGGTVDIDDTLNANSITSDAGVSIAAGQSYTGAGAVTLSSASNNELTVTAQGSGELILTSDFNTGVNIGTSSNTPAPLSVSGGIGNNAALIVDQLNSGDILAASASGTTKFRVDASGNVIASGTINSATFTGGSLSSTAVNGVTTADIVVTSGSYADPAWITSLAKSKVGLGSVENTALSTWAGTSNITTVGTLTSGLSVAAGQGIDTSAAGALAVGNTNATSVTLCNSAACDTVSIGTNTDADTITIGEATDDVSLTDAQWSITGAGAASLASVTVGGDTINEFVGTGLQMSGNSLTAVLGASIANSELDANTIDFDKVTDSSSLDTDWAIAAGAGEDITVNKTFTNNTTENGLIFNFTASDTGAATTGQYGLYLDNVASTEGLDAALVIDNSDADDAVVAAIKFIDAGGGFTNLFDVAGTTITSSEFTILDTGIALSELTDSGTLTAGTVDINGGAIDGTTIGATSRSSGAFTTLASNSTVTIGDGSGTDNITLDDGAGSITFTGYASCTALETDASGILACGTDDGGSGGIATIEENDSSVVTSATVIDFLGTDFAVTAAATEGNIAIDYTNSGIARKTQNEDVTGDWSYTLAAAEALDIASDIATAGTLNILSVTGTPSSTNGTIRGFAVINASSANTNGIDTGILIDNADDSVAVGTGLGITSSGGGAITTALDVSATAIGTALAIGSNDITTTSTTIAATELDRLDGKDAALVDQNDLTSGDGAGGTSSGSGLEAGTGGIGLLQGCADGEVLKWTEASSVWGCATDSTGGGGAPDTATFEDTTDDTNVTWTTEVDVWDGTQPSITTDSASSTVLILVEAVINSNDANDEEPAIHIEAATSPTAASCTSGQVGSDFTGTFRTTAGQLTAISGHALHSPGAAATYNYTVCSGTTGTEDGNVLNLRVTLVELGADLAENYYTKDDSIQPGHIVSIDPSIPAGAKKSTKAYDGQVLGIVSTQPGITLDDAVGLGKGRAVPVALSGRVPVKVTTENGPIKPGDLLTSSSTPGYAMRATKAGQIVGQAMTGHTGPGEGTVFAFVKTDYAIGSRLEDAIPLGDDGEVSSVQDTAKRALEYFVKQKEQENEPVDVSEIITDRVAAGLEIITPRIVADEIIVRNIKAESIEGLEFLIRGTMQNMTQNNADATQSAAVLGINTAPDTLDTHDTFDTLSAKGLSVEREATVSGTLRVKENALIEGVLTVIDTFNTNKLIVNALADFFGNVIFHGDVAFRGRPTFNKDTAGFAVIKKGSDQVEVKFEKEYEQAPIVNVNIAIDQLQKQENESDSDVERRQKEMEQKVLGSNVGYIVSRKTAKGFVIILNKPVDADVTFSWTALAVDKPAMFESAGGEVTVSPAPIASEAAN